MRNLIEFFLIHLVKHPTELSVEEVPSDYKKVYLVKANSDDIGQIIGQGGHTIRAIRKLVSILARDLNEQFEIKVVENED